MQNVKEHIDDIQVKGKSSEDVVVLVELVFLVFSSENELGVVNQVEAEQNNAEDGKTKSHVCTPEECEETGRGKNESEYEKEWAAECEISLCGHRIDGQSESNSKSQDGSLSNDLWLNLFARSPNETGNAEGKNSQKDVVDGHLSMESAANKCANG